MSPRERCWEVNGLRVEGLCWGDSSRPPMLALHGWLDNAASFDKLAPLLMTHQVIALDLTGHGQSSWRSDDATYQIWDDLPEILAVLEQLGWQNFDLIGHSRGAVIGTVLASAIPQRVKHLILLDAILPKACAEQDFPKQLATFLRDKPRRLNRKTRSYSSIDEAVAARSKTGLSHDAAKALARRGVIHQPDGAIWASDPRLHGASAVKLTAGQNKAILESLTMPTLFLQAENGVSQGLEAPSRAQQHIANFDWKIVPGGHHFHMEENVAEAADNIAHFLKSDT